MSISKALQTAWQGSTTEQPAVGLGKAAEQIEGTMGELLRTDGVLARFYAAIVAISLESVRDGFGPVAMHFKAADALESAKVDGETIFETLQRLAAKGHIDAVRTKKGRNAWIVKALGRERQAKQPTAKANATLTLADALLKTAEPERPKTAPKGRLVGRGLAAIADAVKVDDTPTE